MTTARGPYGRILNSLPRLPRHHSTRTIPEKKNAFYHYQLSRCFFVPADVKKKRYRCLCQLPIPFPQCRKYPNVRNTLLIAHLVEGLHHGVPKAALDVARPHTLAESEHALDNAQLSGGGVQSSDRHPVVDHHTRADERRSTVDGSSDQRHLQQRTQLVLVLYGGLGVDDSTLVAERAVRPDQHVLGDGLAEHLDAEDIGNDLLRLALNVGVHQRNVVVAANDVAQRRQTLFHPLDLDRVGDRVPDVLQFLVGGARGEKETATVTAVLCQLLPPTRSMRRFFFLPSGQTSDDSRAGNAGVAYGDDILEFRLKHTKSRAVSIHPSPSLARPMVHTCRSSWTRQWRLAHMSLSGLRKHRPCLAVSKTATFVRAREET